MNKRTIQHALDFGGMGGGGGGPASAASAVAQASTNYGSNDGGGLSTLAVVGIVFGGIFTFLFFAYLVVHGPRKNP